MFKCIHQELFWCCKEYLMYGKQSCEKNISILGNFHMIFWHVMIWLHTIASILIDLNDHLNGEPGVFAMSPWSHAHLRPQKQITIVQNVFCENAITHPIPKNSTNLLQLNKCTLQIGKFLSKRIFIDLQNNVLPSWCGCQQSLHHGLWEGHQAAPQCEENGGWRGGIGGEVFTVQSQVFVIGHPLIEANVRHKLQGFQGAVVQPLVGGPDKIGINMS